MFIHQEVAELCRKAIGGGFITVALCLQGLSGPKRLEFTKTHKPEADTKRLINLQ